MQVSEKHAIFFGVIFLGTSVFTGASASEGGRRSNLSVASGRYAGGVSYTPGNDRYWVPLSLASKNGNPKVVEMLIKGGFDVEGMGLNGLPPLLLAANGGNYDAALLLLDAGANIENGGKTDRTPLLSASSGGHTNIVKLLLKRGANINAVDKRGRTPLFCAQKKGHTGVVEMLLAAEAEATVGLTK